MQEGGDAGGDLAAAENGDQLLRISMTGMIRMSDDRAEFREAGEPHPFACHGDQAVFQPDADVLAEARRVGAVVARLYGGDEAGFAGAPKRIDIGRRRRGWLCETGEGQNTGEVAAGLAAALCEGGLFGSKRPPNRIVELCVHGSHRVKLSIFGIVIER